jgi:alpha-tubulin suppressor-like RCC1 family protein
MDNKKPNLKTTANIIKLYSWGFGKYGQIGTCNYQYTAEPHMIKVDNKLDNDKNAKTYEIKQLYSGEFHSAYLTNKNHLYTYGKNTFGQLGHGNEQITYLPKLIKLDPKILIQKVACGGEHTMALSSTNDLYTWGLNVFGQLGHGNTENTSTPTIIMYLKAIEKNSDGKYEMKEWTRTFSDDEKIVDIAAGAQHSMISTNKNYFYTCGYSKNGCLGYAVEETVDFSNLPTTLFTRVQNKLTNKKILKIACGVNHSGCILEKNEIVIWGKGETLNYDLLTVISIATPKMGEDNLIVDLKIGENFFAVVTKIGEVFTCGTNDHGELGLGSQVKNLKTPERVPLNEKIRSISVGYKFVIAISQNNKIFGWGSNRYGQLLESDSEKISYPKELVSLSQLSINELVCGGYHTVIYELSNTETTSINESALASCKMIKINKCFDPLTYKQLIKPIEDLEEKHNKVQADLLERDKEIEKLTKSIEEKKSMADQISLLPQRDKRSEKSLGKAKPNFNQWDEEIKFEELVFPNNCKVGIGTFGEVKKGFWRKTLVAIKFLKQMENEEENIKTFVEELNILKKLRHPNILLYIGASVTAPYYFLVTEYCENGNLFDYIHASSKRFTLKNKDRLKIALEIARGVNYLHSFNPPILHRDLKSLNILLDKNLTVKIADFGWARLRDIHMTKQRGTFQWMAPEVIKKNNYTEKADVYSYAIILWELWVQEPPYFNVDRVYVAKKVATDRYYRPQLTDEIPEDIQHLIVSCWDYDPDKRPTFEMVIEYLKEKASSIL